MIVFKDLQKLVSHSQREENTRKELFQRLKNKPFWTWNIEEHKQEDINTEETAASIISLDYLLKMGWKKQCLIMKKYCTIPF